MTFQELEREVRDLQASIRRLEGLISANSGANEVPDNFRARNVYANKLFRKGADGEWDEVTT